MSFTTAQPGNSGLSFRPFDLNDIPAVHEYASDPLVVQWSVWGPNTLAETTDYITDAVRADGSVAETEMAAGFTLAAVLADVAIGSLSIWTTDAHDRTGELGYTIHRAHWGNGYATEAVTYLLKLGFEKLRLERICATCDPANRASIRVLEKSGFTCEGRLRSHKTMRGARRDSLLFSILPGEPRRTSTVQQEL